jgi:hypothetical protein|tara:strand:+ start:576 stop:1655 length:1080 start_codon:yes stop_codon:yes gene_type:complete
MQSVYDRFLELLHDFESLPDSIKSESIFDVAGYPHYENVSSNILAFYLNPNNEHGLGNLLFSSLMNLAGGIEIQQENVQVSREVSTKNNGRLDIVIETDNQIIGIENKIYHHLNNDLNDYSRSIDEWAKPNNLDTTKIILSIRNEGDSSGFINVTYENYCQKIKENLGNYVTTSSQKWVLYLIDFMSTIEKLSGGNMEIDDNDQFFIENEERVISLINARNKFISKLNGKIREIFDLVQKPDDCDRQWIYAKSCLVHDYNLSGNLIAFDLYISSQGWEFKLFGRNVNSKEYLRELFSMPALSGHTVPLKDSRHVLNEYDLSTDLTTIKEDLLEWFGLLIQAENEKNANKATDNYEFGIR